MIVKKKKAFTKDLTYIFFFRAVDQSFFSKPQKSVLMLFSVNHGPIIIIFLLGLTIFNRIDCFPTVTNFKKNLNK